MLIECALGARWGFHKFPPDPEDDDPVGEGRLSWRDQGERPLPVIDRDTVPSSLGPETMALAFDLSLPLKPQLEQARRQLQMEAGLRRRQGRLVPKRVSTLKAHWKRLLRLLDAEAAGELEAFGKEVAKEGLDSLAEEAGELMRKGYLELLRIPG